MREGRDAEFWIDTRKIHCFDPASGDNLTRDAEAGAALTREATEDRVSDLARVHDDGDGQAAPYDGGGQAGATSRPAAALPSSDTQAGGGSRRL